MSEIRQAIQSLRAIQDKYSDTVKRIEDLLEFSELWAITLRAAVDADRVHNNTLTDPVERLAGERKIMDRLQVITAFVEDGLDERRKELSAARAEFIVAIDSVQPY